MEKKQFRRRELEPQMLTICGEAYPALYSMAAIEELEDKSGVPCVTFLNRMFAENRRISETAKDVCLFAGVCLRAGGTEVADEDLLQSLDFASMGELIEQLTTLIEKQAPEGGKDSKKAKKA